MVETSRGQWLDPFGSRLIISGVRQGSGVMNTVRVGRKWWAYFDDRQNHLRDVVGGSVSLGTAILTGSSSLFGGEKDSPELPSSIASELA